MVLEKLMMESMLDKIVASIYNDDRGTGLFLDLASYYLTTENNAGQYYPDYYIYVFRKYIFVLFYYVND